MVNPEIPKNYTASPSSFVGTPYLTINREAAFDLDTSNAFEGPEKLLEVWFAPSANELPQTARPNGLKAASTTAWTEMLDLVHCKVLSVIESDDVDAYLLSESSMFVFPHKLVLKTCGITTLLWGLPRILEIAALCAGFPCASASIQEGKPSAAGTYRVFYSRKNYLYPEQQRGPHRSWRDEVRALDRLFRSGSAYMIGKMNGEHWYLYITEPDFSFTPPLTPPLEKAQPLGFAQPLKAEPKSEFDSGEDETLEILMTDLDEDNAKQFTLEHAGVVAEKQYFQDLHQARQHANNSLGNIQDEDPRRSEEVCDVFEQLSSENDQAPAVPKNGSLPSDLTSEGHALGTVVSNTSGLADVYPASIYPEARIDAYLFNPCGFSANGVVPAPQDVKGTPKTSAHYFTVHVTPEPQCSYASFETNVPARQTGRETAEIIEQVVKIFKPGRFSVTLFEAKSEARKGALSDLPSPHSSETEKRPTNMENIQGYRKVDRIVHDLNGYDLIFLYFERHNFKGGAPRIGEIE